MWQYHFVALAAGFVLDCLFGDPYFMPHPIRWMGRFITGLEKVLYKEEASKAHKIFNGSVLVVLVAGVSFLIPAVLLFILYQVLPILGFCVETILCYQFLAMKSLKTESMKVYTALQDGDLIKSRQAVSMIVGRDTQSLTQVGVAKAAVETVAENTSDGVIAPLLYMALGGAALGSFYKAVNTMDSMVGYKNERYLYYGRCAARLDDLLNYLPSRAAAVLMILSAFFLRFDGRQAFLIWRRDGRNHASPNSAQTEAVTAGALGIQLAGDAWYFGKLCKKPFIGDSIRSVEPNDIKRANHLLVLTSLFCLLCILGLYLIARGILL